MKNLSPGKKEKQKAKQNKKQMGKNSKDTWFQGGNTKSRRLFFLHSKRESIRE